MLGSLSAFGAVPSIAVRWRHEPDPRNASDPGPSLRVTRPARNGEGRLAGRPSIASHQAPDARKIPTFALPRNHGGHPCPVILSSARSAHLPTTSSNRSEEHTSELQSLMRISYAVFCLTK